MLIKERIDWGVLATTTLKRIPQVLSAVTDVESSEGVRPSDAANPTMYALELQYPRMSPSFDLGLAFEPSNCCWR